MALETLKNVKEIGGYPLRDVDDTDVPTPTTKEEWDEFDKKNPIWIDHESGRIMFRIQSAPVKEVGVNGCQVDTLIEAAKLILEGLDDKLPCSDNNEAIRCLSSALYWLKQRTIDREQRGVEGTYQP